MYDYYLYRLGQLIALSTPLRIAYALAVFISDVRSLFAYQDRHAVAENLKVIFPEKTDRQIRNIRIRMFRNFAKYLVDFFRFEKITKEYIAANIRLENMHYFDQALSKGKGVIVLSAHLGNWELGGAVTSLLGYPLWAVVLPHKDKKVDDFFNFQRQSKGLKIIPLGQAVRLCLSVLRQNMVLALVGDRDFTQKGVILDFFGKRAFFPKGPAAFSLKAGSTIVPGFMIRNDDDSFTLKIEKPIQFVPKGNKEEDVKELIGCYKLIIEDYIRKYPDQWYMFRRFWVS